METNLIDESLITDKVERKPFIPWYQLVELGIYALLFIMFILNLRIGGEVPLILCLGMVIFSFIMIWLERRDGLIEKSGVVGRIIMRLLQVPLLIGFFFELCEFTHSRMMLTVGLLTVNWQYVVYPIFLKNVRVLYKVILAVSAWFVTVAPIGILFKIMSWPSGQEMLGIGLLSMVITLPILIITYFIKRPNFREQYHLIYYFFRYLALTVFVWLSLLNLLELSDVSTGEEYSGAPTELYEYEEYEEEYNEE